MPYDYSLDERRVEGKVTSWIERGHTLRLAYQRILQKEINATHELASDGNIGCTSEIHDRWPPDGWLFKGEDQVRRLATTALVAFLVPLPALAQLPTLPEAEQAVKEEVMPARVDVSFLVGQLAPTDWSDTVILGSLGAGGNVEQVVVRDFGVEPATSFGATVTYWRGRYGFRVHGAYSSSCVQAAGRCPASDGVDADVWLVDVGAAIGLRRYDSSQVVHPYVFAGIGAVTYDLERPIGPEFLSNLAGRRPSGFPLIIEDDVEPFLLSVDRVGLETKLAGTFGVGTDIRLPIGSGGIGLRLEASDHVSDSPVDLRLTSLETGFFGELPETRVRFDAVHHFRFSAGLVVSFGVD